MPAETEDEPVENLIHERERYGGVRHDDPVYVHTDLALFQQSEPLVPTAADWNALQRILEAPARLDPQCKAEDLQRALQRVIPSNRNERCAMIVILSTAGILKPRGYPTYFDEFVLHRPLPPQRFADWGYPTIWWRASDGVNEAALDFWFPEMRERLSRTGGTTH
jgi:hypothetical protein